MSTLRKWARARAETFRHALWERSGGACEICGCPLFLEKGPWKATIDHIQPVSKGGSGELDNLQLACGPCNSDKGSFVAEDERKHGHAAIEKHPPLVFARPVERMRRLPTRRRRVVVRPVLLQWPLPTT